jgi:hypothetical protein
MNKAIPIMIFTLSLAPAAAFGQPSLQLLAPLAPFVPAGELPTPAAAQQDMTNNNVLLGSLSAQYVAASARIQGIAVETNELNALQIQLKAPRDAGNTVSAAEIAGDITALGLSGILNGPLSDLDSAFVSISNKLNELKTLNTGLSTQVMALQMEMSDVHQQISYDTAMLAKAQASQAAAPTLPPPAAPTAIASTSSTPAVDPIPGAVKAAKTQLRAAIAAGIKTLNGAPPRNRGPIQEGKDKLDDMRSADVERIADLETKYEAAWRKPSTVKSGPAAMMPALSADLTALLAKQEQAITTTVQAAVAAASAPPTVK